MNIKSIRHVLPYGKLHLTFAVVIISILTVYTPIFVVPLIFVLYVLFSNFKHFILSCIIITMILSKVIYNEYFYTKLSDGNIAMNCNVMTVKSNGGYLRCGKEKVKYYISDNTLNEGDIIYVNGITSTPKNNTSKYGFNYRKYLLSQKVNKIVYINSYEIVGTKVDINYLRGKILDRTNKLSTKSSNYVNKILFNNNYLDDEINDGIKNIGISHIFAISGMHITILFNLINSCVNKFNKNAKRGVIAYPVLFFYWSLANFSISITRALFMLVITDIFKKYNEPYTRLDILSLTGTVILLLNPFSLFSYSFILSIMITFALIYYDALRLPNSKIMLPIFLQVMILPFIINMNNQVNLIFIISNIIFLPIYMYLLFPLALVVFIAPILEVFFISSITIFEYLLLFFDNISMFTYKFATLNTVKILLYYTLLTYTIHLYEEKNARYKNILILTVVSIFLMSNTTIVDNKGYVKFYDVGQGDSILIKEPRNRCNLAIDSYNNVSSILLKEGVKHLDYLVITHGHDDHYGDYISMFEDITIDNLILPYYDYSEGIDLVVTEAVKQDIPISYLKSGDSFKCGTIIFDVISPYKHDSSNINNNSLTISAEINELNFLFTGDIEKEVEREIIRSNIPLDIDILKVAHHGSDTSSTKEFIEYINPTYGIISVKNNNRYGIPSSSVLDTFKHNGVYLYRTDLNGTIEYIYKNNKAYFKTYPPNN